MTDGHAATETITIVGRVRALLLAPRDEWQRIAAERRSRIAILRDHVLPLAAIGPLATLIGSQAFGYGSPAGTTAPPPLANALARAAVGYAFAITSLFLLAALAAAIAPRFGADADRVTNRTRAFRLIAYAATATWLAGVVGLVPALALFGLLGLYSIWLLHTGAGPMMGIPPARAAGFTTVVATCALLLAIVGNRVSSLPETGLASSGKVMLPDGRTVDRSGRRLEVTVGTAPVSPDLLQALFPAAVGAYRREADTATDAPPMASDTATPDDGLKADAAPHAAYRLGERTITLTIIDLLALPAGPATMPAPAPTATLAGSPSSATHTAPPSGEPAEDRSVGTRWDAAAGSGRHAALIGGRFLIVAEGNPETPDLLLRAVATIDPDDLADLSG